VKNQVGETVLRLCKRDNIYVDPLMAEALGVRWAIQVASAQGITSASFFSDASNVVNAINGRSTFAAINFIVQDCRDLMSPMLDVSVMFVSKNHNCDAHNLVSLAKIVGDRTWHGVAPNSPLSSVNMAVNVVPCNHDGCVPAFA